jgi:hypothetical protein
MAWIESHQELKEHPKTKRLARLLDASVVTTVGHLHFFWWWAMVYAEDGDLSMFDNEDIADAACWEGDAERFVSALTDCGLKDHAGFLEVIDGKLVIHDWQEYGGRLAEKKEQNRERQRNFREKHLAKTSNANAIDDKRVSNALPNANVTNVTRDKRVSNDATEQNSTEQYSTEQDRTEPKALEASSVLSAAAAEEKPEPEQPAETQAEVPEATPTPKPEPKPTLGIFVKLWNRRLSPLGFPSAKKTSPERERHFAARLNDDAERQSLAWWEDLITRMEQSSFFREAAANRRPWLCVDWVLNETNLVKLSEGKYDDRPPPAIVREWREGTPEELEAERRRQELRGQGFRGDPNSPGDIAAWERHLARMRAAEGGEAGVRAVGGD